ncbi:MAG: LemA family protein [Tenericutes bacterium]|nr:LemA family protein [Mycoplasmatota bacterium]
MSKKMIIPIIIGVVVLLGISIAGSYNSLVSLEQKVEKEGSNIEIALQRRADLIPNLVATVQGYAKHEKRVIDAITTARTELLNASGVDAKSKANEKLTTALNSLFVIVENYPDLKASTNFIQLQDELAGTENRLATVRRDYNDAVNLYNTKVKSFPTNLMASMFGFEKKELFEAAESSYTKPVVEFE